MPTDQNNETTELAGEYRTSQRLLQVLVAHPILFVISLALCHFITHVLFFMLSYSATMHAFDSGAELSSGAKVISFLTDILSFPLVLLATYLPISGSALWGWFIVISNSLLWGVTAWIGLRWLRKRAVAT
jgi:hypothetical protein